MNLSVTRLITVSAFVVVLGLGASQANAQKATFSLPFEVRWGSAVLDPGNYTLSAADSVSGNHIYYLHSAAGTQIVVPAIVSSEAASGRSFLKLVNVDGTYYVREYVSGAAGMTVKFAIPKASHRELSAQDSVLVTSDF